MIDILYTRFPVRLPEKLWLAYMKCLPEDFRKKNQKYRRWEDRHANLLGKLLLVLGLSKYGYGKNLLTELSYTAEDRPYLDGQVDFNISHSGNYVICAISNSGRLGVDIEEVKPIGFDNFEAVMNLRQWQEIKAAEDPIREFYEYWTIKESIIKADGRGVNIPLKELNWQNGIAVCDDKTWNIQSISINEGYASHLATAKPDLPVNLRSIDFYDDQTLSFWQP